MTSAFKWFLLLSFAFFLGIIAGKSSVTISFENLTHQEIWVEGCEEGWSQGYQHAMYIKSIDDSLRNKIKRQREESENVNFKI